jgi:hypothetical protein
MVVSPSGHAYHRINYSVNVPESAGKATSKLSEFDKNYLLQSRKGAYLF